MNIPIGYEDFLERRKRLLDALTDHCSDVDLRIKIVRYYRDGLVSDNEHRTYYKSGRDQYLDDALDAFFMTAQNTPASDQAIGAVCVVATMVL